MQIGDPVKVMAVGPYHHRVGTVREVTPMKTTTKYTVEFDDKKGRESMVFAQFDLMVVVP